MSVHLIWSQDAFAAEELTSRIVERFPEDREVLSLEAEGSQVPGLQEALFAPSLFAAARVVVVRGGERLGPAAVKDVAAQITDADLPEAIVVVAVSERQPSALMKALEGAEVHRFTRPKRGELIKLVERRLKRTGLVPGSGSAAALVDAVGSDLRTLANAVEQLSTRLGKGTTVDEDAVAAHFSRHPDQPVWALFDAIVARDAPRAYSVLNDVLEQGQDAIPVLFALVSQLRYVIRARGALERSPDLADAELATMLGVSAGRAAVLRRQSGQLPWERLLTFHAVCAEADVELKGGEDGAVLPPEIVLERLVGAVIDAA